MNFGVFAERPNDQDCGQCKQDENWIENSLQTVNGQMHCRICWQKNWHLSWNSVFRRNGFQKTEKRMDVCVCGYRWQPQFWLSKKVPSCWPIVTGRNQRNKARKNPPRSTDQNRRTKKDAMSANTFPQMYKIFFVLPNQNLRNNVLRISETFHRQDKRKLS